MKNYLRYRFFSRFLFRFPYLIVGIIITFSSCNSKKASEHIEEGGGEEMNYEFEDLETYTLPGLDHGLMQSPINILSTETAAGHHEITLHFNDEINEIENLGHTILLDFQPGSTITFDENVYEFLQLHFHTPSEHLVDGITYPMEMHIVNVLRDSVTGKPDQYLVLGYLFRMGEENLMITEFLDLVPQEDQSIKIKPGLVKLRDAFIKDKFDPPFHYYYYRGSFTTPPYTESVTWIVLKQLLEASPQQIRTMNQWEGDNARHIQGIFDRKVTTE
jgi:carbonic anhydrase